MQLRRHILYFFDKSNRRYQFTAGRVVNVVVDRIGCIRWIVVRRYNPTTDRYDGARLRVRPDQWRKRPTVCGVLYRGKLHQP